MTMMNVNVAEIAQRMYQHVTIAQEIQGTLVESSLALQAIKTNTENNVAIVGEIREYIEKINNKL